MSENKEFKFTFQDCQELLSRGDKHLENLKVLTDLYEQSGHESQKHQVIQYILDIRIFGEELESIYAMLDSKIEKFIENYEGVVYPDGEDLFNKKINNIDHCSKKTHEVIMFLEWMASRSLLLAFMHKSKLSSLQILMAGIDLVNK